MIKFILFLVLGSSTAILFFGAFNIATPQLLDDIYFITAGFNKINEQITIVYDLLPYILKAMLNVMIVLIFIKFIIDKIK